MPYKEIKVKEKYIPKSPKLMDQIRETLRYHHYSIRTEKTYINWIFKYINLTAHGIQKRWGNLKSSGF